MNTGDAGLGHLIINASCPADERSNPIYTQGAMGFSPDLAWDWDATWYLTGASPWLGIA